MLNMQPRAHSIFMSSCSWREDEINGPYLSRGKPDSWKRLQALQQALPTPAILLSLALHQPHWSAAGFLPWQFPTCSPLTLLDSDTVESLYRPSRLLEILPVRCKRPHIPYYMTGSKLTLILFKSSASCVEIRTYKSVWFFWISE